MKTLRERLSWARAQKAQRDGIDFTQQDLASKAGVTQGSIAHLESGRTQTSRSLTKIAAALGVAAEWLADGKGNPFAFDTDNIPRDDDAKGPAEVSDSSTLPGRTFIRKVKEIRLSAGISGARFEPDPQDNGLWDLPTRWLQKRGLKAENLVAIDVRGESMEPNLYEGDLVVIDTADTRLVNGEVYAVNYEGEAVIKRMVREAGAWYLSSDNTSPKYGRRVCRGTDCIVIGKVVRRETDHV